MDQSNDIQWVTKDWVQTVFIIGLAYASILRTGRLSFLEDRDDLHSVLVRLWDHSRGGEWDCKNDQPTTSYREDLA